MKKIGKGMLSALAQDGKTDFMLLSEGVQRHIIATNLVVDYTAIFSIPPAETRLLHTGAC